jgi:hypothetical protein
VACPGGCISHKTVIKAKNEEDGKTQTEQTKQNQ